MLTLAFSAFTLFVSASAVMLQRIARDGDTMVPSRERIGGAISASVE